MPTATAEKEHKVKSAQKPAMEIAQDESTMMVERNFALAEAYEQMGLFKASVVSKATMLSIANLEGMPLSGIDIIKTQQGYKFYVNQEGAKYNRDKYLGQQGREVSGRIVEILDTFVGADAAQDKAQLRKYFKTTTKIKSKEYSQIVEGIANGKVDAATGLKILDKIEADNTYVSYSSFSTVSEPYNKTPEHIIKKGQTQAHRRADLEISKQCVLPADEEPMDAEFTLKTGDLMDKAKEATGGSPVLKPDAVKTVVEVPATAVTVKPAEQKAAPGPGAEGKSEAKPEDPEAIKAKITELRAVFDAAKLSKFEQQKWMTDNKFPIKPKEMTVAILEKAIATAHTLLDKPAQPAQEAAPAAADPQEDPARKSILSSIFGFREKAGFESETTLRDWVKNTRSKGLSEMTAPELTQVDANVRRLADILAKGEKWGMTTPQLKQFAVDSQKKDIYSMNLDELSKFESDTNEVL